MTEVLSELARLRARRVLDLVDPAVVVAWAEDRGAEGVDLSVLASLAGLPDLRAEDVDAGLAELAEALGLEPLTKEVAGVALAQEAALKVATGELTPIAAAEHIWRLALIAPSAEPRLRVFIALASEWQDDPVHRDLHEEDIRTEAIELGRRRLL